jgi:hypothetical protein
MNYSLYRKTEGGDFCWVQDVCGTTLEEAFKRARKTEEVNGNKIKIIVTDRYDAAFLVSYVGNDLLHIYKEAQNEN